MNFFGYGNLKAPYWFVGFEEGFPPPRMTNIEMLHQAKVRAKTWSKFRGRQVLDIRQYHKALPHRGRDFRRLNQWFRVSPPPLIQPTWRGLIYLLLTLVNDTSLKSARRIRNSTSRGERITERIRDYQRSCWGCENGRACLLEMYGLPNPSATCWLYGRELGSREAVAACTGPTRKKWFSNRLKQSPPPKLVVLYKNDCESVCRWSEVCGIAPSEWKANTIRETTFRWTKKHRILFVCMPHSTRSSYTFLNSLAKFIRPKLTH